MPDAFGDKVLQLFDRLQPNAVMFQGPGKNAVRWAGTEGGVAPIDTWSTSATSLACVISALLSKNYLFYFIFALFVHMSVLLVGVYRPASHWERTERD